MIVTRSSGRRVNNVAAVGSATAERNIRNNIDSARARTRRPGMPARRRGPVPVTARAAC